MLREISLSSVDYVVGVVLLLAPIGIGVWYAVKDANKSTRTEYLLGGRKMSFLPVALSLFITYQSAISMIGIPAEVYNYGAIFMLSSVGYACSFLFGAYAFVPLMYPLQITSVYEYLKLRYGSESLRILSTVVAMFSTMMYMAITLLAPALALQSLANVPLWMSVAAIGSVGTFYTAIGGIKSVIWTDVLQCVIFFIGIFAVLIRACMDVDGLQHALQLSREGGRTDFNKFSPDLRKRYSIWSLLIGFFFIWMVNAFNQSSLQRVICLNKLRDAKLVYVSMAPLILLYYILLTATGLALYAYFAMLGCEPLEAGMISNMNQVEPFFVLFAMNDLPGVTGFFISVLCCGSLSTLSSGINALATNTVEDILRRPLQSLREETITFITKLCVVAYGVIIVGLAYLAKSLHGPVTQMANSIFAILGSPILGVYLIGGAVPWANKYGALAGLVTSTVFNFWISIGSLVQGIQSPTLPSVGTEGCEAWPGILNSSDQLASNRPYTVVSNITNVMEFEHSILNTSFESEEVTMSRSAKDPFFLYAISYEWYSFLGVVVCIVVGLTVSCITNTFLRIYGHGLQVLSSTTTDARYIFPFLVKFWGLSESEVLQEHSPLLTTASNGERYSAQRKGHFGTRYMLKLRSLSNLYKK